jgi:hypothetical protein
MTTDYIVSPDHPSGLSAFPINLTEYESAGQRLFCNMTCFR